ncbi:MAG: hypothetical protein CVU42_06115 [Chloroflexi bacterium HGW-Chloroflexi-4]|jgi:hypothetical protein|nr:MAG: hypothetical protein CVU42_06115 [Chloroflexi bacterium HGW-Chloroflexi-4]
MINSKSNSDSNRLGLHYFQDTLHYSAQDLSVWLPELTRLNAAWVVLLSDSNRAIPENFITGLVEAGIQPIVHFKLQLPNAPSSSDLKPILSAYARWGVKHVVFFDKPNDSSSWSASGWSHQDLVERFIDRFLPLALEAQRNGLTPVFPPLMPGGSYWDTSFFKTSLQSLARRGQQHLLNTMAAGVYAYTYGHELSWGMGGPDKWIHSRPYLTPIGSEDQRGFNSYEWMGSLAASAGIKNMPFIQFGAGIKQPGSYYSPEVHAEMVEAMLSLINDVEELEAAHAIMACNFWLLAADPDSEEYSPSWVKAEGTVLPVVRVLAPATQKTNTPVRLPIQPDIQDSKTEETSAQASGFPIEHYLLLPVYEWGLADWHLDVTRPFVRKYKPTVGFSLAEAALARKVTIIGGEKDFSSEEINKLRDLGCLVDQITGDGTSIATQLLER